MRRLARRSARWPIVLTRRALRRQPPLDEQGALLVEYSMLILLIAVVCIAAVDKIGQIVEGFYRLGEAMFR